MKIASRRSFLKASGAAAAATLTGSRLLSATTPSMPIGLQLYSVRELLPKDFDGTLRQLGAAGFKEVEAAGYFNKTAAEFRHAMDQAGLRCISTHHPLSQLKASEDQLIEYGHQLGLEYIVCPSAMHRDPAAKGQLTLDDWRYSASELNRIGEKVKKAGMTLGYHNHTPEFGSEGGVVFYDELLRLTDPKLVVFEMDCGWVYAAGQDPVTYLKRSPGRFPLLHVKAMAKEANGGYHSVVMGHGAPGYKPIFAAATGLKHYFIEQEEFTGDILDELRQDAAFMRKFSY